MVALTSSVVLSLAMAVTVTEYFSRSLEFVVNAVENESVEWSISEFLVRSNHLESAGIVASSGLLSSSSGCPTELFSELSDFMKSEYRDCE